MYPQGSRHTTCFSDRNHELLRRQPPSAASLTDWVSQNRARLCDTQANAKLTQLELEEDRANRPQVSRDTSIAEDDCVCLRHRKPGKQELHDRWLPELYILMSQPFIIHPKICMWCALMLVDRKVHSIEQIRYQLRCSSISQLLIHTTAKVPPLQQALNEDNDNAD